MSKLPSMFVREVEGKQIRLAQYYRSKTPPSEDWVIAGVELVFENDTLWMAKMLSLALMKPLKL